MKYIIDEVTKSDKYITGHANGTRFGIRNIPELGMKNNYHIGNDYNTPSGTKLYAPVKSEVLKIVDYNDGTGYGYALFLYMIDYDKTLHLAHMKAFAKGLKVGQILDKGAYVGLSGGARGDIGRGTSTGAHLHLGIARGRKRDTYKGRYGDGTWENPSDFDFSKTVSKPSNSGSKKVTKQLVQDVRAGKYGNDPERSRRLREKGYDPKEVQAAVNKSYQSEDKPKPKPKPENKPANNIGKTWRPKKLPLSLYPRSTGGTNYAPSNADRSYKVLDEKNGRIQIQHKLFDAPGNKVWVNKGDGSLSGGTSKPKPKPAPKPKSDVGKKWTPNKVPLTLYPKSTGGTSYAPSRNKRTYTILAEKNGRVQIKNKHFQSPGNKVWVRKSDGKVSGGAPSKPKYVNFKPNTTAYKLRFANQKNRFFPGTFNPQKHGGASLRIVKDLGGNFYQVTCKLFDPNVVTVLVDSRWSDVSVSPKYKVLD